MIISAEHSGFWYALFYQLAFVATFVTYLFICWRQKRPLLDSLLIGICGAVFAIVGSKLGTFSWSDWEYVWQYKMLPPAVGKTTIGAFILGSLGLILAKKVLKYPHSILDALVFAVPVALIFQRLGCFLAGCCFGVPTNLPWGVQYGQSTHVCQLHYLEGYTNYPTALSSAIHPVPLYFILAAMLSLGLLIKYRSEFKSNGSLFLFGISTLFAFRLLIEFFREPITNHNLGAMFLGLKWVQWGLVFIIAINILLLYWNERRSNAQINPSVGSVERFFRTIVLALMPLSLLTLGGNWFDAVEVIVLRGAILILCLMLMWRAFFRLTIPRFRMASVGLMITAVMLMAQYPATDYEKTRIEKKTENIGKITGGYTQKKKVQTISFGYLGRDIDFDYTEFDGCLGAPTFHEVGPTFSSVGLNYDIMWYKNSNVGLGFGFGGHYTTFKTRINGGLPERDHLGGITGYYQMEVKDIFGFKAGMNLGHFPTINGDNLDSPAFPLLYLRFGPGDRFFLDGGLANDLPFGFTASFFQMGGGVGLRAFDIDNPSRFRMGVTKIADRNALYFSSDIYVQKWIISPTVRVSGGTAPNYGLKLGILLGE